MVAKMMRADINCVVKAILAYLSHEFFSFKSVFLPAVKNEIVEIMDATNASNTKKWPICPGNKCSPSNCIAKLICDEKSR